MSVNSSISKNCLFKFSDCANPVIPLSSPTISSTLTTQLKVKVQSRLSLKTNK